MKRTTKKPHIRLMLDSGAFSAYSKGETINLDEYIAYIKKHEDIIDTYFNLDIIAGSKRGAKRTSKMIEESAAQSRRNFLKMRTHWVWVESSYKISEEPCKYPIKHSWVETVEGNKKIACCSRCASTIVYKKRYLCPIPVFHQEEDFKWLHQMIEDVRKDKNPYIALSTFKTLSIPENRAWLDRCFTILTDSDGWPLLRVHGLGIASFDLLKRYPWFSCDATSWALTAAYGSIYVPVYRKGKPDYAEAPVKLTVSEQGKKDGSLGADHYLRMGPMMKERVTHYLESEVGVRVQDAAKDYEVRARAIVFFYLRFQEAIGERPFRHRKSKVGLFQEV